MGSSDGGGESKAIKKQRADEKARLAQEKSDISEKKALSSSGLAGRAMLMKSNQAQLKTKAGQ